MDILDLLDSVELTVSQSLPATVVPAASSALLAPPDLADLPDLLDRLDPMAILVLLDLPLELVVLARLAPLETLELLDSPVILVSLEEPVTLEDVESVVLDLLDVPVPWDNPVSLDSLDVPPAPDNLEPLVLRDLLATLELLETTDSLDSLEDLENLERMPPTVLALLVMATHLVVIARSRRSSVVSSSAVVL